MVGGWFVGNFEPNVLMTRDFEVAIKSYKKGSSEQAHVHKVALEITVVVQGSVNINGQRFEAGAIVTIEPGERASFEALEDSVTAVVKLPSVVGDKYFV